MKQVCIFCGKEIKKKTKGKYGFCISCKIDSIRNMIKPEYTLMVKGEDTKVVSRRLVKELRGQGYKVIK